MDIKSILYKHLKNSLFIKVLLILSLIVLYNCSAKEKFPVCTSLSELKMNEGDTIIAEGIFKYPKGESFASRKIILRDNVEIILNIDDSVADSSLNGIKVSACGIIFIETIPDKYQIIGRNDLPHMVEVFKIKIISD